MPLEPGEQAEQLFGTVFEWTKLPLTRWFLAIHLMTQAKNNIPALELNRHLGVRHKAAWLMKHKLLQVMAERKDSRVLDVRVAIDDAHLGGEKPGTRPATMPSWRVRGDKQPPEASSAK